MARGRQIPQKLILRNDYAVGDVVVFTAAIRDLHRCHPGRFLTDVRTPYPALWENNPYITPLSDEDPTVRHVHCEPDIIRQSNEAPYHYIQAYTEHLNRELKLDCRQTVFHGDLHLSELEKSWYSQVHELVGVDEPFWIVAAGGKTDVTIKWWSTERYQRVVDAFRGSIRFVQVGELHDHHPALDGVIDLRGKTDLRQLIRLVYHSQGVLCGVTSLMHLAAAVERKDTGGHDRPCVVVAGAREPSQWEAYPGHQYISNVGMLRCSKGGCWRSRTKALGDGSDRDMEGELCVDVVGELPRCMDMISADEVIRRVRGYFEGGACQYLRETAPASIRLPILSETPSQHRERKVMARSLEVSRQRMGLELNGVTDAVPSLTVEWVGLVLRHASLEAHEKLRALWAVSCERNLGFWVHRSIPEGMRSDFGNQMQVVKAALQSACYDWILWADCDRCEPEFVEALLDQERDGFDLVWMEQDGMPCADAFLVRAVSWGRAFLELVIGLSDHCASDAVRPHQERYQCIQSAVRALDGAGGRVLCVPAQGAMRSAKLPDESRERSVKTTASECGT